MIPTYNCAGYLARTLASVLDQAPGPDEMEICVVDDCSTADDPRAVVAAVGGDRVTFVQQERNVGHVQTFNACLQRARGEWVHLLHGDDLVEPGFYAAAERAFRAQPQVGAVVCRYLYLDDATGAKWPGKPLADGPGVLTDWPFRLAEGQLLQAPSIVVQRRVYERVGGFDLGIAGYGEDWEMWIRVAAAVPVAYVPEPLAVYRIRPGSLSDPSKLARNMRDMRRVMALNALTLDGVLPERQIRQQTRAARRSLGFALLRRAHRALDAEDRRRPSTTVREALRFWPSPRMVRGCVVLLARWSQAAQEQ